MAATDDTKTGVTSDEKGYLADFDSWNEDEARELSRREGIDELTDGLMDVIRFLRSYSKNYN